MGANLQRANLGHAKLFESTNLNEADLRHTKDLPISVEEARKRGAIV
jgi:uncharacterized protein YjbI with pentapeptide repeats